MTTVIVTNAGEITGVGDDSATLLWTMLLLFAGAGLAVLRQKRWRKAGKPKTAGHCTGGLIQTAQLKTCEIERNMMAMPQDSSIAQSIIVIRMC